MSLMSRRHNRNRKQGTRPPHRFNPKAFIATIGFISVACVLAWAAVMMSQGAVDPFGDYFGLHKGPAKQFIEHTNEVSVTATIPPK